LGFYPEARTALIVAVAGTTTPGTAGQRIATGTRQAIATTTWVLALPFLAQLNRYWTC